MPFDTLLNCKTLNSKHFEGPEIQTDHILENPGMRKIFFFQLLGNRQLYK